MSEPDYNDIVYRLRNPTFWFFQIVGPKSGATVHGESDAPREAADEIERLRAELAAALQDAEDLHIEVEHYANLAIVDLGANPTVSWMERAKAAEAERDELRALLVRSRAWIVDGKCDFNDELADDIDAALNKGGGEG